MSREEAIEIFKRLKENAPNEMHLETIGTAQELFEMAIQALSQEPTIGQLFSCEEIEELRSKIWKQVEQEPKSGKWVDIPFSHYFKCSECGKYQISATNYCPICGCRMVEPQESEE